MRNEDILRKETDFYDAPYRNLPMVKLEPERQTWVWWENYLGPIEQATVLCCGMGKGHHAIQFALAGASRVIGVDISSESCRHLKEMANVNGVDNQAIAVRADLAKIGRFLAPNSVNMVWGQAVLHHIVDIRSFGLGLKHVLKDGGCALFRENWGERR
ncbi:hypothetical protein ES702_00656 [subsurface metagenome]